MEQKFTIEMEVSGFHLYNLMLQDQIRSLINHEFTSIKSEFEYIKKILFAYYGWKWNGLRGWFKKRPYHENPEIIGCIKNLLTLSNERIFTVERKIKLAYETYLNLCKKKGDIPIIKLNDISKLQFEYW